MQKQSSSSPSTTASTSLRPVFHKAVADGIREHVPAAVGVIVRGSPLCLLAWLSHAILGASVDTTVIGTAATTAGTIGATSWRRRHPWTTEGRHNRDGEKGLNL
jgi:hypothetical protein